MKKIILIPLIIVFIGNITGQGSSDLIISEIDFDNAFLNRNRVVDHQPVCLMGYQNCQMVIESDKLVDDLNESILNRIENRNSKLIVAEERSMLPEYTGEINIIEGGIPADYGDITGSVVQIKQQKEEQIVIEKTLDAFTLSSITCKTFVTKYEEDIPINKLEVQNITRIPTLSFVPDEIEITTVSSSPMIYNGEKLDIDQPATEGSSQGPITGLEGHNFIEDPAIIYPNPVKDVMNVKSTDPITVIEILNLHGQVEMEMDPRSTMDVSGLAAGTYYVRMHFENIKDVQVEKIMIIK